MATFAEVLLHVLEQAMRLQTDPPLHCLLEEQAYHNTVDTRQINHVASDESTALTNIQLARQLANYLPMRGEQHKRSPQRNSKNVHCLQQPFLVIITPVAGIINAIIYTYSTRAAYDNCHIRYLVLIPDSCIVMALHPPNCNTHVILHKLVTLFTKPTAAILDDDYMTNNFMSASLDYDFPFWVGIQSFVVHCLTARRKMGRLTEHVLARTTTVLLSDFHAYAGPLKETAIHFEEQ
jgi:hypothetical protein